MAVDVRFASPDDAETIHRFVRELAEYEKEPDAVVATPADFRSQMAQVPPPFEALIAEIQGDPVGFALFFHNYSTWRGRPGLYIEDLYVQDASRRQGVGEALAARLAHIAAGRGCDRMEWAVLTWNEPAIRFYEKLGAKAQREWMSYRLTRRGITELARRARAK